MNNVNVTMYIIESSIIRNPKGYESLGLSELKIGKELSNVSEIKVNKSINGYSIIYDTNTFINIDNDILRKAIINIFEKNLNDVNLNFKIECFVQVTPGIETDLTKKVIALSNLFTEMYKYIIDNDYKFSNGMIFNYEISESLKQLALLLMNKINNKADDELSYYRNEEDIEDDDYDDEDFEEEDDDDDDEDDEEILGSLDDILRGKRKKNNSNKKKSTTKKTYGTSIVMKETKNPKKNYNRHGVMICDKDSIKKDEKILKAFLKDFMPGNQDWKKDFRDDVLKRWIQMYVVTKKQKNKLEKQHRKLKARKRYTTTNADTRKALEFTQRLFNTPIDRWNDPSR